MLAAQPALTSYALEKISFDPAFENYLPTSFAMMLSQVLLIVRKTILS